MEINSSKHTNIKILCSVLKDFPVMKGMYLYINKVTIVVISTTSI